MSTSRRSAARNCVQPSDLVMPFGSRSRGSRRARPGLHVNLLCVGMIASLWIGAPLAAQVPEPIEKAIVAAGRVVDGPAMEALYRPLQEREPYSGVSVARGLKYGPLDQQAADVFVAQSADHRKRPVLIFAHGGGFTSGARRSSPDSPFYDNVALWAARHGFVAINIDYQLAPAAIWPSAARDIAKAVHWARENAASYGGDPKELFLMGHSAGATHIASYGGDPALQGEDASSLRGLIIVSGSYTVQAPDSALPEDKRLLGRAKVYFGDDPAKFAAESSLAGLIASKTPLLLVNSEFEPDYFLKQRALLLSSLPKARSKTVSSIVLAGHNHMSEINSINTTDASTTNAILTFVRRNTTP